MTAESSLPPSSPRVAPQMRDQPAPQGSKSEAEKPSSDVLRPTANLKRSSAQDATPQQPLSSPSTGLPRAVQSSPVSGPSARPHPPISQGAPAPVSAQSSGKNEGKTSPVTPLPKGVPHQGTPPPPGHGPQAASQFPAASPRAGSSPRQSQGKAGVQIQLKTEQGRLHLHIPPPKVTPLEWSELWQQLQQRLDAGKRFWTTRTPIDIIVGDRLLDQRQLQQLAASLAAVNLHVERVHTIRRQTAVAAVTAGYSVEQQANILPLSQSPIAKFKAPESSSPEVAEPLYLQTTLRSGSEIRHPGTVVIVGDLNPGSTVIANDDIVVWGRLRGIAHAGAEGNRECRIMALQMEPTQLRIADLVARAPDQPPTQYYPEVAHIAEGRIQITQAAEFAKKAAPPLAQLGNKA